MRAAARAEQIPHWLLVEMAWDVRARLYRAGERGADECAAAYPGDDDLRAIALSTLVDLMLTNPGELPEFLWPSWNNIRVGVLGVDPSTLKPLHEVGRVDHFWLTAIKGLVLGLSEAEEEVPQLDLPTPVLEDPGLRKVELI
jgi:hypothetical protein